MKNLSIKFIGKLPINIRRVPYLLGQIAIGDFSETFNIAIQWWKKEDYEYQWCLALKRLKDRDQSCFVAEVSNRKQAHVVNWWLIYKKEGMLYIQNEVLFGEDYRNIIGEKQFTPVTCFDFIGPKQPAFTEDGTKVSEWVIPFELTLL